MAIFFYLFLFIIGASIGSFLGVIVDRLESKEPFWKGRSHCDHCRHKLGVGDLIPILSFFLLQGKCRYCHKKLSWFYLLIEVLTGLSYAVAGYVVFSSVQMIFQLPYQLLFLYFLIEMSTLLVIFFADLRYGIIPFKAVAVALVVTILWYLLSPFLSFTLSELQFFGIHTDFFTLILSALGAGGFFLLLFLLTKGRGMGFGDVVYAFLMGFTLGFPRVFLGLYLAFVTGAIISLGLVAVKKKQFKGGTIPFGPFLVFGTVVSLLWGNVLLAAVLRFLAF